MPRPIIGELIAGLLPGHALLDPFRAAALLLPCLAGAGERARGVGQLLHPLVTDLGQPEFDWLGLGAGDALDEAQEGLGGGDVGEIIFPVGGGHFQLVTVCHQLTAFFAEPLFQLIPILSGRLGIRLLREYPDDVHD